MDGWFGVDRCRRFVWVSVDGLWCLLQCCLTQVLNLLTISRNLLLQSPWTVYFATEDFSQGFVFDWHQFFFKTSQAVEARMFASSLSGWSTGLFGDLSIEPAESRGSLGADGC